MTHPAVSMDMNESTPTQDPTPTHCKKRVADDPIDDCDSLRKQKSKKFDVTVEHTDSATADAAIEASEIQAVSQNNAVIDENAVNQSSKQKQLEINSVLCFLSNKIDNYSRNLLESTVLEFFREDEILIAKQSLSAACAAHNKTSLVQQYLKRRIGENKVKSNVDDILNILYTLDENDSFDFLPLYCVAVTSRMPFLTDELSDIGFIKKVVVDLQSQLAAVKYKLQQLAPPMPHKVFTEMAIQTEPQVVVVAGPVVAAAAAASSQSSAGSAMTADASVAAVDVPIGATISDQGVGLLSSLMSAGITDHRPTTGYSSALKSSPAVGGSAHPSRSGLDSTGTVVRSSAGQQPSANRSDEGGFSLVTGKKKTWRRKVVVGGQHNAPFHGVEKKVVLCVNRLNPDTDVQEVVDHLLTNNVHVFTCFDVTKRKSIEDGMMEDVDLETKPRRFISMRLCVSQSDVGTVMSSDMWPRGVTVRPWTFKAKPAADR